MASITHPVQPKVRSSSLAHPLVSGLAHPLEVFGAGAVLVGSYLSGNANSVVGAVGALMSLRGGYTLLAKGREWAQKTFGQPSLLRRVLLASGIGAVVGSGIGAGAAQGMFETGDLVGTLAGSTLGALTGTLSLVYGVMRSETPEVGRDLLSELLQEGKAFRLDERDWENVTSAFETLFRDSAYQESFVRQMINERGETVLQTSARAALGYEPYGDYLLRSILVAKFRNDLLQDSEAFTSVVTTLNGDQREQYQLNGFDLPKLIREAIEEAINGLSRPTAAARGDLDYRARERGAR